MLNSDEAGYSLLEDSGLYGLKLKLKICFHGTLSHLTLKKINLKLKFLLNVNIFSPIFNNKFLILDQIPEKVTWIGG